MVVTFEVFKYRISYTPLQIRRPSSSLSLAFNVTFTFSFFVGKTIVCAFCCRWLRWFAVETVLHYVCRGVILVVRIRPLTPSGGTISASQTLLLSCAVGGGGWGKGQWINQISPQDRTRGEFFSFYNCASSIGIFQHVSLFCVEKKFIQKLIPEKEG